MDLKDQVDGDLITRVHGVDAVHHGINVPEHFHSRDVGRLVSELTSCFRSQEPTGFDFKPLDL